jgi:hypothetical protein
LYPTLQTVAAINVLAPGIGDIIGSSQREARRSTYAMCGSSYPITSSCFLRFGPIISRICAPVSPGRGRFSRKDAEISSRIFSLPPE